MYYQYKFDSKRISSPVHIVESAITVVPSTLKIANQLFCITLCLIMMHQNIKFGNQMVSSLGDIILSFWTNIHWHSEPSLWPWPFMQNPFFSFSFFSPKTFCLMMMYLQTKSGCQRIRRYSRLSHISIIWALTVTLTFKIANTFFHKTLWLMMLHHHTKFG